MSCFTGSNRFWLPGRPLQSQCTQKNKVNKETCKSTALVLLSQVAAVIKHPMTYQCKPGPWSRTWHNRSGRAGPAVATWPRGWGRTTPARRYWLSGTGNPEQLQLSVLSLSLSKRWPATRETNKQTKKIGWRQYSTHMKNKTLRNIYIVNR